MFLRLFALSLSRYLIASSKGTPSSGIESKSMNATPLVLATTPSAPLSRTESREVFSPPPAYRTSCSARCTSGRSSRSSLRATKG
eukprot:687334-Hanusia_phi.AAC.4